MAATIEERLAALEAAVAALTEPPTDYYTSKYSGEEIDELLDKISALPNQ